MVSFVEREKKQPKYKVATVLVITMKEHMMMVSAVGTIPITTVTSTKYLIAL